MKICQGSWKGMNVKGLCEQPGEAGDKMDEKKAKQREREKLSQTIKKRLIIVRRMNRYSCQSYYIELVLFL